MLGDNIFKRVCKYRHPSYRLCVEVSMAPVSVLVLQTWCELCKELSSHSHLMEDRVTMLLLLSHLLAE